MMPGRDHRPVGEACLDARSDHVILHATVFPDFVDAAPIQDGFIAIAEGRVEAVGPASQAHEWLNPGTQVTDASGMVAMPGLVNVHTHLAAGIFRGLLDEGSKGRGLYDIAFPMEQRLEPDDIYWLGLLGCIEVLKAGCTTVNDIFYFADSLAQAVDTIGLRAVLAEKIFDVDLPRIGRGDYTRDRARGERKLAANVELIQRWHGAKGGLIGCRMGTHATDTCSSGLLSLASQEAQRLGVGLHIHVAQSPIEMDHIAATHGRTPVEYLNDLGLLRADTLSVHCSNNSDLDLDLMAETNTAYACCPTMYPRRGRFPRLGEFLSRGIRTGFGTDWIRMDPWEGMRNAMCAVRLMAGEPEALPSRELLDLQTMGSARALGMADDVGSLTRGKRADIVLIDMRRSHLQPFYGDVPGVLHSVYPSDVHTVFVEGNAVLRGGVVVGLDEASVVSEVGSRIGRYRAWREAIGA